MTKHLFNFLFNVLISVVIGYLFYDFGKSRIPDKGLLETLTYGLFVVVFVIYTVSDRIVDKINEK
jgi:hypothetical protein